MLKFRAELRAEILNNLNNCIKVLAAKSNSVGLKCLLTNFQLARRNDERKHSFLVTSPSVGKRLTLVPNIFINLTATSTKHQFLINLKGSFQKMYTFTPSYLLFLRDSFLRRFPYLLFWRETYPQTFPPEFLSICEYNSWKKIACYRPLKDRHFARVCTEKTMDHWCRENGARNIYSNYNHMRPYVECSPNQSKKLYLIDLSIEQSTKLWGFRNGAGRFCISVLPEFYSSGLTAQAYEMVIITVCVQVDNCFCITWMVVHQCASLRWFRGILLFFCFLGMFSKIKWHLFNYYWLQ